MSDSQSTVHLIVPAAESTTDVDIAVPLKKLPQAQSWLADGANTPITAEQLLAVMDPDSLVAVTDAAGIDSGTFAAAVADALPGLIDEASPDGQLDPQFNVRIVGGEEIEPYSHPHQISLR